MVNRYLWHPSRDDTRARGATVRCHEAPHNPRGAFYTVSTRVLFGLSSLRVLRWRFRQATAAGPHPSSPHYPPGPRARRAAGLQKPGPRQALLLLESSSSLQIK